MNKKQLRRKRLLQDELERILLLLKEKYRPQKVILFGSLAEGKVDEWSDLDLLVVKKSRKRFIDRIGEVLDLCTPSVGTDFIVYTPEEFKMMVEEEPFVRDEIVGKGRVLYER